MKKKLVYALVVVLLIIGQLVVEEMNKKSDDVLENSVEFVVVDETDQLQEHNKQVTNPVVTGPYDPILVLTDREIVRNKVTKVCRLNRMDHEGLMTLKGIGEVTADKIIAYRAEVGYFKDLEDLMKINGIGPKKYTSIEEQL